MRGQPYRMNSCFTVADEREMAVGAPDVIDQVADRPQGEVEPVLRAHVAQPAAQQRSAVLELAPWFPPAGTGQDRAVDHHGHRVRTAGRPG